MQIKLESAIKVAMDSIGNIAKRHNITFSADDNCNMEREIAGDLLDLHEQAEINRLRQRQLNRRESLMHQIERSYFG